MRSTSLIHQPIHTAIVRLTAWYMAVIMLLSIGFSLAVYQIYGIQLHANLLRAQTFAQQLFYSNYLSLRQAELEASLASIRQNLILLNLVMLFIAAGVSYLLARRNLQPVAEALEAQSRFTADASHELRTPLTAMRTEIEVALRNPKLTKADAETLLKSNLEEVAKLKSLAEGLLRLAQTDTTPLPLADISLKPVITDACTQLAPAAVAKAIKIITTPSDFTVKADKASLHELLVILLDNAVKYSPPGSTVSVTAETHGKQVHIAIEDRGTGISPQDLPHIFERFYRADTSRTKAATDGYGLGLPIAKQIIEAYGGSIEVRSTVSRGSVFIVKLGI